MAAENPVYGSFACNHGVKLWSNQDGLIPIGEPIVLRIGFTDPRWFSYVVIPHGTWLARNV